MFYLFSNCTYLVQVSSMMTFYCQQCLQFFKDGYDWQIWFFMLLLYQVHLQFDKMRNVHNKKQLRHLPGLYHLYHIFLELCYEVKIFQSLVQHRLKYNTRNWIPQVVLHFCPFENKHSNIQSSLECKYYCLSTSGGLSW